MYYTTNFSGVKVLRLLTLLFVLGITTFQPNWLSADEPCELPCCCPIYAYCVGPPPDDCPGEPCQDKYGNSVACPGDDGNGGNGGGGLPCHDKYGNVITCPPGGGDGSDCGCCDNTDPNYNSTVAAAASCPGGGGIPGFCGGELLPPGKKCCGEVEIYDPAFFTFCQPGSMLIPSGSTCQGGCPKSPVVTWLLCGNRNNIVGAAAKLYFQGAENFWVKEKVVFTGNTCNNYSITQTSNPMFRPDGTVIDTMAMSVGAGIPISCEISTSQTIYWGPTQAEVTKCRFGNRQKITISGTRVTVSTFGSSTSCTFR